MKNLRDPKTKIYPSTTRGGKELPSSSALDSPFVLSKLATPEPASAIRSDMSDVIDDATSAMHDTYDETTSMLDTTVALGEFLDEQIARMNAKTDNIVESDETEYYDSPTRPSSPRYELPNIPEGYVLEGEVSRDFLSCMDRDDLKKLLCKWKKKKSLNARMRYDPKFAI